ncbi:MAG TPA: MFS transporter [Lacunisphaera sp.]|nr:MFS transporter [Lacunisphaera sp.]
MKTPAVSASAAPVTLASRLPLIVALALATGTEAFTTSAVGLALPRIAAGFGASLDEISWAVTLYLAAAAIALPLSSWLSDILGQRRYLAGAMLAYLVASAGCLLSPTLPVFLAWRTLQGAAGSGFIARAIFTFTKEFRPPVLFRVFYLFIGAFALRALGLPFGGYLLDHLSWRWLFAVPVVLLGFGALPALALSTEVWPRRRTPAADFTGLVLLVTGVGALLVLLQRGQRDDWLASAGIRALAAVALVALPLFFWHEQRAGDRRLISAASLRSRSMGVGVTLSFLAGLMLAGGVFVLPLFLFRVIGSDGVLTGWLMSVDSFALMAGLLTAVWVFGRKLTRLLLAAAGVSFAVSMLLFAFRVTAGTPVGSLVLPLFLHGFGVGLALPPIGIFSFGPIGADPFLNAEGRAWHYTARLVGGVVAVAFAALLLDLRGSVHSSRLAEHLTAFDPAAQQALSSLTRGLVAHGFDPRLGRDGASFVLSRLLGRESTLLAFHDLFLVTALVGLVVVLLTPVLPGLNAAAPRPVRSRS